MMVTNLHNNWLPILAKLENNSNLFNLVKRCPLEIMQHWQVNSFAKGTVIFEQNSIYDEFNIIIQGTVTVYMQAESGQKYIQARYSSGDIIGELEIFENKPYVSSIEAETNITLLRISRVHFLKWLELDSQFTHQLLVKFSQQYYQLSKKAAEDSLYNLHQRVCKYLLNMSEFGKLTQFVIDKKYLKDRFAVTLRSINRELQYLSKLNVIKIEGDLITLIDYNMLKQRTIL